MKEQSEQILSFAETDLIQKEAIRAAVLSQAPQKQKKPIAWTKVLLPIAACLVVLCSVVLAIPEARAEVFSWFHASRPEEYLTADPETRTSVPVLDELIVPSAKDPSDEPADQPSEAPVPAENRIASETNNRLLFAADEDVWQQIAEEFAVDIGESMYDGENLYFSVSLHGLTALPDVVQYTGASITQTRVPLESLPEFFEDGLVPKEYADGTMTLWNASPGIYTLLLPNGLELPLGPAELYYDTELPKLINDLYAYYGDIDYTDDIREEINEKVLAWLNGRTVKGVVRYFTTNGYGYMNGKLTTIRDLASYLANLADENGILTGTLLYRARRTEPDQVLLEAEIGTLRIDVLAYNRVPMQKVSNDGETVDWGEETVLISKVGVDYGKAGVMDDRRISLYKQTVSTAGVSMTAETKQAKISALGIRDIGIRIRVPESWTREDREALADSLTFNVQINGEDGDWLVASWLCEVQEDGAILYKCRLLEGVPYETLQSVRTISFIPVIRFVKSIEMKALKNDEYVSIGTLDTEYGKTKWSPLGVTGWDTDQNSASYPQYAIVLTVD